MNDEETWTWYVPLWVRYTYYPLSESHPKIYHYHTKDVVETNYPLDSRDAVMAIMKVIRKTVEQDVTARHSAHAERVDAGSLFVEALGFQLLSRTLPTGKVVTPYDR